MRLLHVINSTDPVGGGPIEAIRQAGPVLERLGHTTEIACLDPPDSPWLKELPIPTHSFGPAWSPYRYASSFVSWLRDHAADYDSVIVHGLWLHASAGTRTALRGSTTPYFIYTHGLLDPNFKRTFPWKHFKKSLMWLLVEHRVVRDARALLFTCEQERDLAAQSFRPFRCNSAIVPYCVGAPPDGPEYQPDTFLNRYPHLRGKRIILFLSRIHPKKGCDLLIEAFARVASQKDAADIHLVMAGPGESSGWARKLKERAHRLALDARMTWTGMLTGHLKWSAFRAADAFILPTHQENFGIAIVEALGCGAPVLITNRVNIWREIVADQAGFVEDAGLVGATTLLERWCATATAHKEAMRANALACFRARFDSVKAGEHLITTLKAHGVTDQPNTSFVAAT